MKKGAEFILFNHLIMQGWAAPEDFKLGRCLEVHAVSSSAKPPRTEDVQKRDEEMPFCNKGNK